MVTDAKFIVDIVRLPIDKPSMATGVRNDVLTKNSDLKYTPMHHNDIEWCCQYIEEPVSTTAKAKPKKIHKTSWEDVDDEADKSPPKPEVPVDRTKPHDIDLVNIGRDRRYVCVSVVCIY